MPIPEIEEFARILVEQVRDAAIRGVDRRLRPDTADPVALRWKKTVDTRQLESIVRMVLPDIVDNTLFYLLRAIDQEMLRLSFTGSSGKAVSLTDDGLGELGGSYMGSPGWRAAYSRERFVDDLSDLGLPDMK
jgi:hypothetical protein